MRRIGFGWAVGVIAPWVLGFGLIVSFTADAGQEASIGASLSPMILRAPSEPLDLVPASTASLNGAFGLSLRSDDTVLRYASLTLGEREELTTLPEEREPRVGLKVNARTFPQLDRSHRADPFVGLRPTFDTKLRRQGLDAFRASELMLSGEEYIAFDGFVSSEGDVPGLDSVSNFEPTETDSSTTTQSVAAGDATSTNVAPAPVLRTHTVQPRVVDGSTPAVPRAIALGSSTPAMRDQTPVEVMAAVTAPRLPQISAGLPQGPAKMTPPALSPPAAPGKPSLRADYAALIDQDLGPREQRCLAEAIYFEARGEPEEGQAAVAQVVLNRASSGLYPTTICGVVYQNRHHHNACQFSFACDGHALRINEPDAWRDATRIARSVLQGKTYVSDVGGSTHYHANYVKPHWARALKRMDKIGSHIFYKLRPGQT